MKTLFILSAFIGIAGAQEKYTVADLDWITGRWEMVKGERRTEEQWLAPEGNTMFAISRTVNKGKLIEYEFVMLDQDSNGAIYYRAKPSGQAGASFRLVMLKDNKAIFENIHHDFPQRIIYARTSDDSLSARIEGIQNGKIIGIDFPYRKIKN
ncbi:MAG: DUF6265 family protein [Bacteroidota bacterium]